MDRFIKLKVEKPLSKADIRAWFNCVVEHGPSGIVNSVTVADDDDNRHVVRLIHQVTDHRHNYVIPTVRDLGDEEVDQIVEQFGETHPDLDFDVELHTTRLRARDQDVIPLDAARHLALCNAMAKRKHEDWVRERTDAGWRYGVVFDAEEKVHPLVRPWDQLPERYRVPDLTAPQQLIDLLNDSGYIVVRKGDLDDVVGRR